MAAVAAVSTSFAQTQASITGGVDFTYGKTIASAAAGAVDKGIAATDAYIDIAASDDLGGGWKASVFMEFNGDGARSAAPYMGDKSISIASPLATLTLVAGYTGGTLGAVMLAPTVQPTDHWTGTAAAAAVAEVAAKPGSAGTAAAAAVAATGAYGVMSRSGADTLVLSMPLNSNIGVSYKYSEGTSGYLTPTAGAATNVLSATYKQDKFSAAVDYNMLNIDTGGADIRLTRVTANAMYDAGFAKFALGFEGPSLKTLNTATTGTAASAVLFGVSAPMGPVTAGLNYGKRDIASFYEIGASYNLSKRTFVTGSYGSFTNAATYVQDATTYTSDSWGLRVGTTF